MGKALAGVLRAKLPEAGDTFLWKCAFCHCFKNDIVIFAFIAYRFFFLIHAVKLNILLHNIIPSPPSDVIWAVMIDWRIRGKLSANCCELCRVWMLCTVICTHIWAVLKDECQFRFRFSFLCVCLELAFCVFLWFSLDYFVLVLFALVC